MYQLQVLDDFEEHWATTRFDDANVLVWQHPDAPVTLEEEKGWFAWKYGKRTPRTVIRFPHDAPAPTVFLTLLVPYQSVSLPQVDATFPEGYSIGADHAEVRVEVFGETYHHERDLKQQSAGIAVVKTKN